MLESLERRQLLTVNFNAGVLTITGTSFDDDFSVQVDNGYVNVLEDEVLVFEGAVEMVTAANVVAIEVWLGAGNDRADLSGVTHTDFPNLPFDDDEDGAGVAVYGESGNDTLVGSHVDDYLEGGADNDSITGNSGRDFLLGGSGADTLDGGDHQDFLIGDIGNDQLSGGDDEDLYLFGGTDPLGSDYIDDDESINVLSFFDFPGPIEGFGYPIDLNLGTTSPQVVASGYLTLELSRDDAEWGVFGTAFDDTIEGNDARGVYAGFEGNDTLIGHGGQDVYAYTGDRDHGEDTIVEDAMDSGEDQIAFGVAAQDDWIEGSYVGAIVLDLSSTGPQVVTDDMLTLTLSDGEAIETLIGSDEDDVLIGNGLGNTLIGGGGNDILIGQDGNDNLVGGAQMDVLVGGIGNDLLEGESGDDLYIFDRASTSDNLGTDTIIEADDGTDDAHDVLVFEEFALSGPTGLVIDLTSSTQVVNYPDNLVLIVKNLNGDFDADGIEVVIGSSGSDDITGNDDANILLGKGGDDTLDGGAGNDWLVGEWGNDLLLGGGDDDLLIAGILPPAGGSVFEAFDSLFSIHNEWASAHSYADRIANLTDGSGGVSGLNGTNYLVPGYDPLLNPTATVGDDGDAGDTLAGAGGTDWFFYDFDGVGGDVATDPSGPEEEVDD